MTELAKHAFEVGMPHMVTDQLSEVELLKLVGDFQWRQIAASLGLSERAAVGVSWYARQGDAAALHPVVRIQSGAGETFIYESACGSGSIALAANGGRGTTVVSHWPYPSRDEDA